MSTKLWTNEAIEGGDILEHVANYPILFSRASVVRRRTISEDFECAVRISKSAQGKELQNGNGIRVTMHAMCLAQFSLVDTVDFGQRNVFVLQFGGRRLVMRR